MRKSSTLNLRQLGGDVFGDAVAQVLVFLHAAQVLEVENGDGVITDGCLRLAEFRWQSWSGRTEIALQPFKSGFEICRALIAQVDLSLMPDQ